MWGVILIFSIYLFFTPFIILALLVNIFWRLLKSILLKNKWINERKTILCLVTLDFLKIVNHMLRCSLNQKKGGLVEWTCENMKANYKRVFLSSFSGDVLDSGKKLFLRSWFQLDLIFFRLIFSNFYEYNALKKKTRIEFSQNSRVYFPNWRFYYFQKVLHSILYPI